RLGTTSTSHTLRAMMSQEPDKRVVAVLETSAPPALFLSVSDRFMQLPLLQQRRETQRLRERFPSSSAISYHTSVSQALRTTNLQKLLQVISFSLHQCLYH